MEPEVIIMREDSAPVDDDSTQINALIELSSRVGQVTTPSSGLQKRTTGGTPLGTGGSILPGAGRQRLS